MKTYLCLILNRYTQTEIASYTVVEVSEEAARFKIRNKFITSKEGKEYTYDWYIDVTSVSE